MNKSILNFSVFILTLVILASCANEINKDEGMLTIRMKSEPERINPILFPNATAREVYQYIFLPLADYNPFTLNLEPILIEEIPDPIEKGDGVSYKLKIKEAANWEDGSPITAEDYLFTLKAAILPQSNANAYAGLLKAISDVRIEENNLKHFEVYFDKDFLLSIETAINFEILPKHLYDPKGRLDHLTYKTINQMTSDESENIDSLITFFGNEFNSIKFTRETISGAGPYRFVSWIPNEQIVLEKKENYWGEKNSGHPSTQAIPKQIKFKIIPDENNALAQFQSGQLDVVPHMSAEGFHRINADSIEVNFQKLTPQLTKYYYFILNTSSKKLKSPAVRLALALLTDNKKYIDLFEKGDGTKMRSFVSPNKPGENTSLQPYEFDVEKANQILAEDGWKDHNNNGILDKNINGENIELDLKMYVSGNLSKNIGLLLKDVCKQTGIEIEVIQKPFKLIRAEHLSKGDFDVIPSLSSQDLNFEDPYDRFHSDNAYLGGSNYAGYKNPMADSLISIIQSAKEDDIRLDAYMELQSIVKKDNPYIYLYAPVERILLSNSWVGTTSIKRPGYFANTFKYKRNQ